MAWHRRRGGHPDEGQVEGVDRLRHVFGESISVAVTTIVGFDFPDLVVGFMGDTILVEWKRKGRKGRTGGKLRPGQDDFRRNWKGGPVILTDNVDTLIQQLLVVGRTRGGPHALDWNLIAARAANGAR